MDLRDQGTKILERFAAVEAELQDPNVVSDIGRMTALNREYSDLKEVVEAFRTYLKALDTKEEAQAVMADASADRDFKDLAQAEYDEAITVIPGMEEALKIMLLPKDEDDGRNVMLEILAGT